MDRLIEADAMPDLAVLERRFAPVPGRMPDVTVTLPSPALYDALLIADALPEAQAAGGSVMNGRIEVDTARLPLLLTELRLPAIGPPVGRDGRAIRPRGMARRTVPLDHRRTRDRRARPATHRASSPGRPPAARQDARRASRPWPPATPGSTAARTCCSSARPAPARPISRPPLGEPSSENGYRVLFTRTTELVQRLPDRPTGPRPRSRHHQARPLRPAGARRPLLCPQGPGRNVRPVRAHQPQIRAPQHADHRQPALWRVEQGVPRSRHDPSPPSTASSTTRSSSK